MKRYIWGGALAVGIALSAIGFRPLNAQHGAVAAQAGKAEARKGIDPDADRILRQMTDYLAGLQSFQVDSAALDEVVTKAGQKVQLASESQVSVQRPNRLRSEQVGTRNGMGFWYDGKTMTLACKANGTYGTLPAPATLDATIDKARKDFQIDAPGADLIFSRPYAVLTEQITGGQFIGRETMDGGPVNHIALVGDEVDLQLWIKDGPEPLPVRYSITTKVTKGEPEFSVHLTQWKTNPTIPASTFQFKAPAGATRAQSFPRTCSPGQTG
ncbi:MAG TPA: DUF2092 domain-containing protein [Polyangia bacterium]|nr:DUF2092 domain-containing protein [Polyangia bacterium]